MEIDYGRLNALEAALGGRGAIQAAYGQGEVLVPQTHRFAFTHDTPNLDLGVPLYTPRVGEVLLDAWFQIDEAWDGTTPSGDFGQFTDVAQTGFFFIPFLAVDMSAADGSPFAPAPGLGVGQTPSLALANAANALLSLAYSRDIASTPSPAQPLEGNPALTVNMATERTVPAPFTEALPISVVVSRDGSTVGGSPGATRGKATLWMTTLHGQAP